MYMHPHVLLHNHGTLITHKLFLNNASDKFYSQKYHFPWLSTIVQAEGWTTQSPVVCSRVDLSGWPPLASLAPEWLVIPPWE